MKTKRSWRNKVKEKKRPQVSKTEFKIVLEPPEKKMILNHFPATDLTCHEWKIINKILIVLVIGLSIHLLEFIIYIITFLC